VLEKLGMTREGHLRDTMRIRDGWRDSLIYSILEPEWRAKSGSS
jgi:RimJ/RimL family protein N-acetyltransferase